ncbi:hypothetical protein Scep_015055 [Stephania cephalantha]|uniref:Ribosomal RNA small subunit methyltransferase NEP1 n=1 Tax=Stephania cephalantha TaxID=152367 RepID=A0AAP0J2G9_9MAGN
MVRPFAVKGRGLKKRKKSKEEAYDDDDDQEQLEQHQEEEEAHDVDEEQLEQHLEEEKEEDGEQVNEEEDEKRAMAAVNELQGIPKVVSKSNQSARKSVVFVLERASLEVGKVGKSYAILNSDDHANFLRRHGKDPASYRPDIVHQALLAILDSLLNKAGRLKAVYVKTEKGVLFEVKPYVRIPRTFKRFCGIMLQLLQKLSISAVNKREKLLRVIKNPVTQHLPVNCRRIGFSYSSEKLVKLRDYVSVVSDDDDLVFVVGAMAHGKIDNEYTDDFIAVSGYPLSAACCIGRICNALEEKWNIL